MSFVTLSTTQFRIGISSTSGTAPIFAIDNVYIGPPCARHCGGHGDCINGTKCMCDPGFTGATCLPITPLATSFRDDFTSGITPSKWDFVQSGSVVSTTSPSSYCGEIFSLSNLYFSGSISPVVRQAVTVDLDTRAAQFIQFYFRLGSTSSSGPCDYGTTPAQNVLLMSSTDGGVTYTLLSTFQYTAWRTARWTTLSLSFST